jgi:hypothetical protein
MGCESYKIITPKAYSAPKEPVVKKANNKLADKEPIDKESVSLEEVLQDTEIILPEQPDPSNVNYGESGEYKPIDLEQVWEYQSSMQAQDESSEYEAKSCEVMDDEEAEEAIGDVQMAQLTGDFQSMSYQDRKRLANKAMYDPQTVRIMHSLNRITDNVDFSRVY